MLDIVFLVTLVVALIGTHSLVRPQKVIRPSIFNKKTMSIPIIFVC